MHRRVIRTATMLFFAASAACLAACSGPEETGAASYWNNRSSTSAPPMETLSHKRGRPSEDFWPSGDESHASRYRVWKTPPAQTPE